MKASRKPAQFTRKALPAAIALVFSHAASAGINDGGNTANLPTGGNGNNVSAPTFSDAGKTMALTLSGRSIIDWATFNIGATYKLKFEGAGHAVLNRVAADAPGTPALSRNLSKIAGALEAPGVTVVLMNPNGIAFTSTAQVNVGSLVATTGQVNPGEFTATGNVRITYPGNYTREAITTEAGATIQAAGLAALVAPSVTNAGTITAATGKVVLAGNDAVTITMNGLYDFDVTGAGGVVTNAAGGTLSGATILLTTGAAAAVVSGTINLHGIQQATNAIVVNGNQVALTSDLAVSPGGTIGGNSNTINVSGAGQLQDAVDIAKSNASDGATVNAAAGTYNEQVTITKAGLKLLGQPGAKISVPNNNEVNGITVQANNVTVSGLEIAGPVTSSYLTYDWGSKISRGIFVMNGYTGFDISNNNIHDLRTGILIDGRNTGSVINNRIENTKSGISVQYTDGAGIAISGNTEGPIGNEWGVNLHLNGYINGSGVATANDQNAAGAAGLTVQQALLALSAANSGWSVQDQFYKSSNRTHATVATTGSASNQGSALNPLNTVQGGIDAVVSGGTVKVKDGTYAQTATLKVSKPLTLRGQSESGTIIDSRTVSGYGIEVTGDNVTLSDFTLYGPTANVGTSYGIKVQPGNAVVSSRLQNFSISRVTSRGAGRAELDLNGALNATIDHFTANGAPVGGSGTTAGAGIQITNSVGVEITNSTTLNNEWGGVALFQASDTKNPYTQNTGNITVATSNSFAEANPLYLQDESATRDFGLLTLPGFGYAVKNPTVDGTRDQNQYTWMQQTAQGAYNLAVNAGNPDSSYIRGWNGTALTQDFYVGVGNRGASQYAMKIMPAVNAALAGATVHLGSGTFRENLTLGRSITIDGAGIGSTFLKSATAGSNEAININSASNVTLSDMTIADYQYGLRINGTSHNVKVDHVAFDNNTYAIRTGTATKSDNFQMLDSSITGGIIGVQTYNSYDAGTGLATGSFANALFDHVTVDGSTYKGFYFETADNLTLRNVTITNTGNVGGADASQLQKYGHAVDINLKYAAFNSINFENLVVKDSGRSSGDPTRGAVVIKTRGTPGDSATYTAKPASLERVNIVGGSIEGSQGTAVRVEDLRNSAGNKPTVRISAGTTFKNNGQDIVVGRADVDATGAVFFGAADGFDIEDRVNHALDADGRGLVTWNPGNVYVTQSSGSIARGIAASCECDTVNIAPGTFAESVVLNTLRNLRFNNTTIQGLTVNVANAGIGGRVTVNGPTGFLFNQPVRLLSDTSLIARGGNIDFKGDVQGRFALSLDAGGGDVSMFTGGTQANPLGRFTVLADDFNLSSTLWVSGYDINTTGNVALADHTLNSVGALLSLISAGGNVTGSTTSQGSLQIAGGGNVTTNIISLGNVEVVATNVGGNITGAYIVIGAENTVNANVSSVQVVEISAGGAVNVSGTAQSLVLNAPSANASGSFGEVVNSSGGSVTVNGKPQPTTRAVELSVQTILPTTVVTAADSEAGPGVSVGGSVKPAIKLATAEAKDEQPARSVHDAAELVRRGQSVEIDLTPGNR